MPLQTRPVALPASCRKFACWRGTLFLHISLYQNLPYFLTLKLNNFFDSGPIFKILVPFFKFFYPLLNGMNLFKIERFWFFSLRTYYLKILTLMWRLKPVKVLNWFNDHHKMSAIKESGFTVLWSNRWSSNLDLLLFWLMTTDELVDRETSTSLFGLKNQLKHTLTWSSKIVLSHKA